MTFWCKIVMTKPATVFQTKGNCMIVIENMPQVDLRSSHQADLRVAPKDISFHDLPGDKVLIQVTVRNAGLEASQPTPMRLESAPLGAFVAWRPLAGLLVPP